MYYHPVILEQGVKAGAVFRYKVRLGFEDGSILHNVAQQDKGRAADLYFYAWDYHTEDHRSEEGLYQRKQRHDRCFPEFIGMDEHDAQQCLPEHPQKEASFLAVPERGKEIICGQLAVGVAVCVVILEIVFGNDGVQCYTDADNAYGMYIEAYSSRWPASLLF